MRLPILATAALAAPLALPALSLAPIAAPQEATSTEEEKSTFERKAAKERKGFYVSTRYGFELREPKKWNRIAVKTEEEWLAALRGLARDPARRRELGAAGRRAVESSYSLEPWSARYAELLLEAAS